MAVRFAATGDRLPPCHSRRRPARHQPGSALTQWFRNKIEDQGKRMKRIAIVGLACKPLVALRERWRGV
jgi:hypothetical protein